MRHEVRTIFLGGDSTPKNDDAFRERISSTCVYCSLVDVFSAQDAPYAEFRFTITTRQRFKIGH